MTDENLFGKAMQGVRQLEAKPRRVAEKKKKPAPSLPVADVAPVFADSNPAHRPQCSETPWVLKADGVSAERMRRLAAGRPPVDGEIDLHGMTRDQMYAALATAMQEALVCGWRVLSVVHGRGLHSRDGRPVLRDAFYRWIAEGPYAGRVLAAIPRPGSGGGSALLLLRRQR